MITPKDCYLYDDDVQAKCPASSSVARPRRHWPKFNGPPVDQWPQCSGPLNRVLKFKLTIDIMILTVTISIDILSFFDIITFRVTILHVTTRRKLSTPPMTVS